MLTSFRHEHLNRKVANFLFLLVIVSLLMGVAATPVSAKPIRPPSSVSMWWLESLGYTCQKNSSRPLSTGVVCSKGNDVYICYPGPLYSGMCHRVSNTVY